jgi:hypothetical protein
MAVLGLFLALPAAVSGNIFGSTINPGNKNQ